MATTLVPEPVNSTELDLCGGKHNVSALEELNITCPESGAAQYTGMEHFDIPRTMRAIYAQNYLMLIWLGVGFFGNILNICVLSRRAFRLTSSSVYMRGLAIADILALCGHNLRLVSDRYFPLWSTLWYCRTSLFVMNFGTAYGSLLIVTMSIERMIAVTWPLRAGTLCTRRRAVVATVVLAVLTVGLVMHVFWSQISINYQPGVLYCTYDEKYFTFLDVYSVFEFCISMYIPALSITFINAVIIAQIWRAQRTQKSMTGSDEKSGKAGDGAEQKGGKGLDSQTTQITAMLLSVSVIYWVTNVPASIYYLNFQNMISKPYSPSYYADVFVVQAIVYILITTNHAINFLLYCMTGKKFRSELKLMLLCREKKRGPTSSNTYMYSTTNVSTVAGTVPARAVSASEISAKVAEDKV